MPPAPELSIGAFSSSASVLLDPDSIESFPTEIENNDNCMYMDTQDSCSILSNDGNDNGHSAHIHNDNDNGLSDKMNIKQSIDHVKNSNLDPSNDTIDSCIQNDINTSNDERSNSNGNSLATRNDVPSNSLASSNKSSSSGSRVAKSTGARVKSQVSGSSTPPLRSSPQVQSQKVRGRHISDAAAVAAFSSVSRSVSSSEHRALQRVFSKK